MRNRVSVARAKHGVSDVTDIAPHDIAVIVDVGANTGQSAIRFRAAFPRARIISFEPVRATFAELERRTRGMNVECHRLALGPEPAQATMYLTESSLMSSLLRPDDEDLKATETVDVATLGGTLANLEVGPVDLLKIDAEGYDLEVLAGGVDHLSRGLVKFVLIEAGFHPGDERHPLFDDVRFFLMKFGFCVFGIYDQKLEWSGEPSLRFANVLFRRRPSAAMPG